jgi:hypothetical protein
MMAQWAETCHRIFNCYYWLPTYVVFIDWLINLYMWLGSLPLHLSKSTKYNYMPFNHLTPNGHFSGRTEPLTYRCCIIYLFKKYTYWIF